MTTRTHRDVIVMCHPAHYDVEYVINPWMAHNIGRVNKELAWKQWYRLRSAILDLGADVDVINPIEGLPDMVFTANAGLTIGGRMLLSRFTDFERCPEESHFHDWFSRMRFDVINPSTYFEGAGDALVDEHRKFVWLGGGFRSNDVTLDVYSAFRCGSVKLTLINPRFYHLDTCFCPLQNGSIVYYPQAFDARSLAKISDIVTDHDKLIAVSEEDALMFSCNAIDVGGTVISNHLGPELQGRLHDVGLECMEIDLSEFIKAGGGAKCLTLRLYSEFDVDSQGLAIV